jgi:hypothetical protein
MKRHQLSQSKGDVLPIQAKLHYLKAYLQKQV